MTVLRNNFGRCNWLGKVSFFLVTLWLVTIFISTNYILHHNSGEYEKDTENGERLRQLSNSFQILKKQNLKLLGIITSSSNSMKKKKDDENMLIEKLNDPMYHELSKQNIAFERYNEPSLMYEEVRRKIISDLQEMWFFMTEELYRFKKSIDLSKLGVDDEISAIINQFNEYKHYLSINIAKLTRFDGYNLWRKTEAIELSQMVQQRFRFVEVILF
ncbi:alpha-(1,6)-fucosyltransferase [Copidosoma floridanum]|uniref:alpha-(1,6)-fucosyltransferase n=1 Tax=Copidosoma floridanum TaxID=29053 RepID=UPI0006C9C51C|nr:alpha-(1,6)-fucosyltransferase [Copidosoma floridanum]